MVGSNKIDPTEWVNATSTARITSPALLLYIYIYKFIALAFALTIRTSSIYLLRSSLISPLAIAIFEILGIIEYFKLIVEG